MPQKYLVALPRNRKSNPTLTKLLENECLFPALPAVSSGRDLIEFLNNPVEVPSNLVSFYQEVDAFLPVKEALLACTIAKPILPPSLPPRSMMSRISRRVWIQKGSIRLMWCYKILRQVTFSCITWIFVDFNNRIATMPLECLNNAAKCAPTCSICWTNTTIQILLYQMSTLISQHAHYLTGFQEKLSTWWLWSSAIDWGRSSLVFRV